MGDDVTISNPQGPNPTKSNPATEAKPGAEPKPGNIETVEAPKEPNAGDNIKTGYDPKVGA